METGRGRYGLGTGNHSQKLKMNIEETKTVKSYISCLLSSLLSFWVVLELFRFFSFSFFFLTQNSSKTTQEPRRDDHKQLKYDLTVSFSFNSENGLPVDEGSGLFPYYPKWP